MKATEATDQDLLINPPMPGDAFILGNMDVIVGEFTGDSVKAAWYNESGDLLTGVIPMSFFYEERFGIKRKSDDFISPIKKGVEK